MCEYNVLFEQLNGDYHGVTVAASDAMMALDKARILYGKAYKTIVEIVRGKQI